MKKVKLLFLPLLLLTACNNANKPYLKELREFIISNTTYTNVLFEDFTFYYHFQGKTQKGEIFVDTYFYHVIMHFYVTEDYVCRFDKYYVIKDYVNSSELYFYVWF